jgi:hypothetical protein
MTKTWFGESRYLRRAAQLAVIAAALSILGGCYTPTPLSDAAYHQIPDRQKQENELYNDVRASLLAQIEQDEWDRLVQYDAHEGGPGNNGGNQGSQSSGGSSPSVSDIRLKRDIVEVGQLANGLHLYHFRYNWADQEYVGVMAQEVEKVMPGAVSRGADGYLRVDYGQLGLRLETWDEWLRSHPRQASRAD